MIRLALRRLARRPLFSIGSIVILAIGVGFSTSLLSLFNAVSLAPPSHVLDPDRIFYLEISRLLEDGRATVLDQFSFPFFETLNESLQGAADVAAEAHFPTGFGRGAGSRDILCALVTEDYLSVVGVSPFLGNLIPPSASGRAVLLSYGFWHSALGADPAIIGETVRIADVPHVVAGVLPNRFKGLGNNRPDAWLPISTSLGLVNPARMSGEYLLSTPDIGLVSIIIRPAPDLSRKDVEDRIISADPTFVADARMVSLSENAYRDVEVRLTIWASAVTLLTLLLATTNVANLILVENLQRANSVAIQLHLGASRWQIWKGLASESFLLAVAAGILGFILSLIAIGPLSTLILGEVLPYQEFFSVRLIVLLVFVAISISLAVTFPVVTQMRSFNLLEGLRTGFGFSRATRSGQLLRSSLVVIQIGISTCLLGLCWFFLHSYRTAASVDLGFEPNGVVVVQTPGLRNRGLSESELDQFYSTFSERARELPGVELISSATTVPFDTSHVTGIETPDGGSVTRRGGFHIVGVSPDYFGTLQIPILRGRDFTIFDRRQANPVAVLNLTAVRSLPSGEDPIGRCIHVAASKACTRIVGVVQDARLGSIRREAEAQVYVPIDQAPRYLPNLAAHRGILAKVYPEAIGQVLQGLATLQSDSFVRTRTLQSYVESQWESLRRGSVVFLMLALLSVLISILGSYSHMTFWFRQRRAELGIRSALGASPSMLFRAVVIKSFIVVGLGVFVGCVLAVPARTISEHFSLGLFPGSWTALGVAAALQALAGLASAIPNALRAQLLDPARTLKAE